MRILALSVLSLLCLTLSGCREGRPLALGPYRVCEVAGYRLLLAESPQQQSTGLMHVRMIPSKAGMVFRLPNGTKASFWMAHCLTDMDMVFLGADGQVQKVLTAPAPKPGAALESLPMFTTLGPADRSQIAGMSLPDTRYVIELAPGTGTAFVAAWRPDLVSRVESAQTLAMTWN